MKQNQHKIVNWQFMALQQLTFNSTASRRSSFQQTPKWLSDMHFTCFALRNTTND